MAVATISAWVIVPAVCASNGRSEVQQVETPVDESFETESIVDSPGRASEAVIVAIYDVPLDPELQLFIIQLCEDYHIDPAIIIAMIERESSFKAEAVGDNGNSMGLMQIQTKWHQERMDRLGVTDLMDPYQNVMIGVDYLAELCANYECVGMALMAYNAGPTGAKVNWWDKGIFENKYSTGVLARSEELTEGMIAYALD